MATMIRPNRLEVSDRFPVAGFTVKTGNYPWFEVALATDPTLFRAERKSQRTYSNFYSSHAMGPLPAERGEAVYLVPPEVLRRFAGQPKLYFGLATFPDANRSRAEALQVPSEGSPWLNLKLFTGRGSRRMMALPHPRNGHARNGNGYTATNADELVWAGDAAQPGREAIAGSPPANGATTAPASPAPSSPATPPNTSAGAALGYDDGFGPMPFETMAESENVEDYGIDEPIPDEGQLATGQSYSRAFTASEYPQANRFVPAATVNYRTPSSPRTIQRIVIHITDGGPNINGTISWFQNPNQQNSKGQTIRASAHYIVGRDGEVVQMVRHSDIAFHAHTANSDSIGIEHVANTRGLNPTEAQYCSSAALVRWLCEQYNIPMDRAHIQGHSEADPHTTHTSCPNAVWDWDYFMGMVTSASCYPQGRSQGLQTTDFPLKGSGPGNGYGQSYSAPRVRALGGQSFDINWNDLELIPQPTNMSCWATAAAMIVGWRDQMSLTPDTIATLAGRTTAAGLNPADKPTVANAWGLFLEPPQSYSLESFRQMLETQGPLWVGAITPLGRHAIVVTGMYGDGVADGSNTYVRISDPWDRDPNTPSTPGPYRGTHNHGSRYVLTWNEFVREYEAGITSRDGTVNVQIIHTGGTDGRVIGAGQGFSRGQQMGAYRTATLNTRAFSGQSFDVNWSDVQLVPQLTSMSCWAAAAAMVVGWRDQISINPTEIDQKVGVWGAYAHGLYPRDHAHLAEVWGLVKEPPQSYSIEGFRQLLENNGPLWIGVAVPSGHAVAVIGLYGDGTPDGTYVRYNDPWPVNQGAEGQVKSYREFIQEYENRVTTNGPGNVNIQIIHANGRRPLTTSQGYGTGYSARTTKPSANRRARGFSDEAATNGSLFLKEADYSEEIGEAADPEQDVMASGEKAALTNEEIYRIIREVATADSGDALYSAVSTDQASQFGLAFGLVLFTQHSGRLGHVLQLMQRRDAATFAEIFGPESETLLAVANAATPRERLQPVGGEPLWNATWVEKFRRVGEVPVFQAAQNEEAIEGLFRPMLKIASRLGLISDRGLAMAYDRVVTRGLGGGLRWLVQAAGALRTAAQRQHALQMLGYENLMQFQAAVGDIPQNGIFGPETHAALIAALRQQGAATLPSSEELVCRLVAMAQGAAKKRLMQLRDSGNLTDVIYNLG